MRLSLWRRFLLFCLSALCVWAIGAWQDEFAANASAPSQSAQPQAAPATSILPMEAGLEAEFESYFGRDLASADRDVAEITEVLGQIAGETDTTPAVLWAIPRRDHLHLVMLTQQGEVVRDRYDVPEAELRPTVRRFFFEVARPRRSDLAAAQQLHRWIVEPFEAEYFQAEGIDSLLICLGNGLRGLPIAALYDGDSFLIERYNLTRIPAFNLIDTDYKPIEATRLLTMGASEFDDLAPLPAVPFELDNIRSAASEVAPDGGYYAPPRQIDTTPDPTLLNTDFTVDRLRTKLAARDFDIIHLATHALFNPGEPDDSFIRFWETAFPLSRMNELPWNKPALDLLVLSACQTATGDDGAELGFAGLALQSGVKTAIASLWSVSDLGTAALMSELYRHFDDTTTKAEALRQTQLALLNGDVRIEVGELILSETRIPIPAEFIENGLVPANANIRLDRPFFWAGFTTIGSPW
ncbi:MAG: CHAT domain-containing protein [Geitlerinemataceae cyanobacterium]